MELTVQPMPPSVVEIYEPLKTEIVWLYIRWRNYQQLFGHSDQRIELLNDAASSFFFIAQEVMFDEIQLALCKLADPASTGKFANLSMARLLGEARQESTGTLPTTLIALLDTFQSSCRSFVEWRNKRIAHFDLEVAKTKARALLSGTQLQIEAALESLRLCMNAIEVFYKDVPSVYEMSALSGDAEDLVRVLKAGIRYFEIAENDESLIFDNPEGRYAGA